MLQSDCGFNVHVSIIKHVAPNSLSLSPGAPHVSAHYGRPSGVHHTHQQDQQRSGHLMAQENAAAHPSWYVSVCVCPTQSACLSCLLVCFAPSCVAGGPAVQAPIYVRHSSLRLPYHSTKPVIMVGPGTGLAPFRSFIQERAATKQAGQCVGSGVALLVTFFVYVLYWPLFHHSNV